MTRLGSELTRKAVHVSMGGFALALRWLTPAQAAGLAVVALAFNLLLLHRVTRRGLLRDGERERGFSWGIALYPAAVLATILVFHERLELAAGVWALLAFGDGMATVAGVLVRGPALPWNRDKTWSGFIAFVLWGSATAAFLVRWTQRAALEGRGGSVGDSFLVADLAGTWPDITMLVAGCVAAALAAALAESLRTGIDDNILVPLVGGAALWGSTLIRPSLLASPDVGLLPGLATGAVVNAVFAIAAGLAGGVGLSGALVGWVLGTLLWGLAGWPGFALLLTFFVLGTVTTKLGRRRKEALGIAQERGGRRGAKNAVANVTAGVILALFAAATPYREPCLLAMAAAFATAACDTVSSEIGQAYGRRHWLVTRFRRVPPGTDGAISVEGTLAGLLAAIAVALVALAGGVVTGAAAVAIVAAAGFLGALIESWLGAVAVDRMREVDNEVVNFANTVVGALIAIALYSVV